MRLLCPLTCPPGFMCLRHTIACFWAEWRSVLCGIRQLRAGLITDGGSPVSCLRHPLLGLGAVLHVPEQATSQLLPPVVGQMGMHFGLICRHRANIHIARRIGALIAEARHHVLSAIATALLPFTTGLPDAPPFIECQKERNTASFCVKPLPQETNSLWVLLCPIVSSLICWISHWFCSIRSMVRGGGSVASAAAVPLIAQAAA